VANWASNQVSVIDGQSHKLITQIKTGDKSRAFGQFILPSIMK
jgi:DNA-binding beta-propeller fold protein YncE